MYFPKLTKISPFKTKTELKANAVNNFYHGLLSLLKIHFKQSNETESNSFPDINQ